MARPTVERHVQLPPFQALLDAHGRDVHRFLVATVGPVDADDCYQETWIAALRAYPRLRDASNLRAWVMKVAHNKAIDLIRARRRAPVAVAEVFEDGTAERRAGAISAGAGELPSELDGLWGQVAALPVKQRAAVAMRFIADAGYDEIATAMGTSEDAARRNVFEGLKRLRKELGR